jgi:hypothetical protein
MEGQGVVAVGVGVAGLVVLVAGAMFVKIKNASEKALMQGTTLSDNVCAPPPHTGVNFYIDKGFKNAASKKSTPEG